MTVKADGPRTAQPRRTLPARPEARTRPPPHQVTQAPAGPGRRVATAVQIPAATASVTVLVQPVVTTALGWVLFGELLSAWQAAGAVLALTGVVLAQRASDHRPAARHVAAGL